MFPSRTPRVRAQVPAPLQAVGQQREQAQRYASQPHRFGLGVAEPAGGPNCGIPCAASVSEGLALRSTGARRKHGATNVRSDGTPGQEEFQGGNGSSAPLRLSPFRAYWERWRCLRFKEAFVSLFPRKYDMYLYQ